MNVFPKLPTKIKLVNYKDQDESYMMVMEDLSCIHLFINERYQESFVKDAMVTNKVFWDFVDETICHYTDYRSEGKVKNLLMAAAEYMDIVFVSDL